MPIAEPSVRELVADIKAADQDFEFYPTTDAIIAAVVKDLKAENEDNRSKYHSVLDIGAGNGKVLEALRDGAGLCDLHAIEKSTILCEAMNADIMIVGTEFAEQSLLLKHVEVIFSNPPYSEFEQWAVKIIRQAASKIVYLVIPQRWEKSVEIAAALNYRSGEAKILGRYDFLEADRVARAKVHLLRIKLDFGEDAAFHRFFKEQFADLIAKFDAPKKKRDIFDGPEPKASKFAQLVVGPNYPEALVSLYTAELAHIEKNYALVAQLDADLLKEFNIDPDRIAKWLMERLSGLRSKYWHELFSNLTTITSRLTHKSRNALLNTLHKHVQVDFTVSNICAVVIWVIKNTNRYLDSQLIETFEQMVEQCNVKLYKSNDRTWDKNLWRYNKPSGDNTHFALDYRIITYRMGGIINDSWRKGIEERGSDFLGDLLTVASNLGFRCGEGARTSLTRDGQETWRSGESRTFHSNAKYEVGDAVHGMGKIADKVKIIDGPGYQYKIGNDWYHERCVPGPPLFEVKAFKNGNQHIRFQPALILALNVEHGRLKGWLRSASEAVDELGDPGAADYFRSNIQLTAGDSCLLLTN